MLFVKIIFGDCKLILMPHSVAVSTAVSKTVFPLKELAWVRIPVGLFRQVIQSELCYIVVDFPIGRRIRSVHRLKSFRVRSG